MAFKTNTNTNDEIKYEVIEDLGSFSNVDKNGWQYKLRLVSWNGREPKYDIRQWSNIDGEEQMRKGISMDGDTIAALTELLVKVRDAE